MLTALTVWDLVQARADLTPDDLCVIDDKDNVLTFGVLHDEAERVAAGLVSSESVLGRSCRGSCPTASTRCWCRSH